MRNLKKILALVLALVMVIGMMSIASAATPGTGFADDAEITKYDEAVQILEALGIYKGDGEGNFEYNEPITRAETAALIYRIVHDEKYVGIYADYNKFDDVASNAWYAGYVNYCANGEFIVGDGNGSFNPNDYVTGYQVLAIVLRLVGYDREGEFQGAGWEVRTARKAKELGITSTIVDGTLGANATRGMVAELIYRSIAQTSTVSWSLLTSYVPNGQTLANEYFGLRGTETATEEYEEMVENAPVAAEDSYYGEPVSYWYHDSYPYVITVRYNPVASYSTGVTGAAMYNLLAAYDANKDKDVTVGEDYVLGYSFYEDGVVTDSIEVKSTNKAYVGGNGTVTDVFVVDSVVYVVIKNTYIDQVATAYNGTTGSFKLLSTDYATHYPEYKGNIGAYNMVLFNMYNGTVDTTTLHVAKFAPVTVSATYDNTDFNTSYFKAGNTKYSYNANYHVWATASNAFGYEFGVAESSDILNGKVGEVTGTTAFYGLGSKANVFYDDFGNVILLGEISTSTAKGVGVVIGADTLRIGLGKYVVEMDVIGTDGAKKNVKAVVGPIADWTYDEQDTDEIVRDLMDNGSKLISWTIDAETGYYVVNDNAAAELTNSEIVRGDANAIEVNVDDTAIYIVETYKNDGAEIKGYDIYKGFKKVPTLENLYGDYDYKITYTYNTYTYSYVVFITGATKGEQPATVTVPELVYVLESVPEKNLYKDEDGNTVTYWNYLVVKNGQVTTLKSKTDPSLVTVAGLYEIEKDTETRNFFDLTLVDNQRAELELYSALVGVTYGDVLYAVNDNYYVKDNNSAAFDKLTLADSVKVYAISGTTLTEITLADLDDGMKIEFLVDKYGYVTTIFVVAGFDVDIDGTYHEQ